VAFGVLSLPGSHPAGPSFAERDLMPVPSRPFKHLNKKTMRMADYELIAGAIRMIPDIAFRMRVADHFAKFFHSKIPTFDPQLWYMATGGLVNRPPAAITNTASNEGQKINTSTSGNGTNGA
jgi:hypothetical protein